jgi:Uncharacterized low-complexity proteins
MQDADLHEVGMRWADLRGVDLRWASLQGANLQGANLQWANLQVAMASEAPDGWTLVDGRLQRRGVNRG